MIKISIFPAPKLYIMLFFPSTSAQVTVYYIILIVLPYRHLFHDYHSVPHYEDFTANILFNLSRFNETFYIWKNPADSGKKNCP